MTKIIRISLNSYPTKYNLSSCVIGGAFQGEGRGDLCKTCANPGRLIVVMIVVTLIVSSLYCSLEAFSRLQKKRRVERHLPNHRSQSSFFYVLTYRLGFNKYNRKDNKYPFFLNRGQKESEYKV